MKMSFVFASAATLLLAIPSLALQPKQVLTTSSHVKMVVSPKTEMASNADILFIVDDSGSMQTHQENLAANMPALAASLKGKASLHAAVTTSTFQGVVSGPNSGSCGGANCINGRFITTPAVLTSDMPDFIAALMKGIPAGTMGSGEENLFSPIIAALTPPLSENANAGFLRADAHLAIVMLTDAEDQSDMTPEQLVSGLEAIKGQGNFTIFGFIIPTGEMNCQRDQETSPAKIEKAIALTGGEAYNICSADYAQALQKIGGAVVTTMERTIRLPLTPIAGSLKVEYGTRTLMAGDIHNGWVYDSAINAVILGDKIDFSAQPNADLVINFDY